MWRKIFSGKNKEEPIQENGASDTKDETEESQEESQEESGAKVGIFARLKQGLTKTKTGFVGKVEQLIKGRKIDEALFEELEEILIQADVGFDTTMLLTDKIRQRVKEERIEDAQEIQRLLKEEIVSLLSVHYKPLTLNTSTLASMMIVGVNGAGKTTTIGKLAYRFKQENAKVLLGAGDTFRAAAIDQLQVWANRVAVDIVAHQEGSDPGAVAFDTVAAAQARKADIMILDTAGRLQTKTNLMAELGKVHRVVVRELGNEIDEILLVVDATTGQNALSQARLFKEAVPLTGIVLTKLDGTAKGGIILALAHELELPVKLIGVGEQYTDLQDFDPEQFAEALFS